jgi:RNA recognition motif-containing protein
MRLNYFVRYYGSYESLEVALRYCGASALDDSEYVPVPVATDSWEDTNEPSFNDHLVDTEDLNVIDNYTELLEFPFDGLTYDDLRSEAADAEITPGIDAMRSLIVCYFPREANKDMIRRAFSPYGPIDSVYLVHKDGKPACYGFVNFSDHPSAASALAAANSGRIELVDKRDAVWNVKAEWTLSQDIPKKPKKKRFKKDESGKGPEENTPSVDLNRALMKYHPNVPIRGLPKHARSVQTLNYTVPTVPQEQVEEPLGQCGWWDVAW